MTGFVLLRRVGRPMRRALGSDFIRHSALVFAASFLTNAFNYAFNFALSRRLGVENYAVLSSLVSGLMILSIPGGAINLLIVKYAAEFHADGSVQKLRRLSSAVVRWSSCAAVGVFLGGFVFRGLGAAFLRIDDGPAIGLALIIAAVSLVTPAARGILQGQQSFLSFSISLVLEALMKFMLAVLLVYMGFGVMGAMVGWACGSIASLAYTIAAVGGWRRSDEPIPALLPEIGPFIRTSVGVVVAYGTITAMGFMDVLLVKHFFDARSAGLYAAVSLTGKVILFLANFLPMIVLPKAVAKAKRGESPVLLLVQSVLGTVLISGIVLTVFGSMPQLAVGILAGQAFIAATPYVLQYDAAMAMLSIVTLVVNYRIGLHQYGFLASLVAVLIGEIVIITVQHNTLWNIIHTLLIGNTIAAIFCVWGVRAGSIDRTITEDPIEFASPL